MGHSAGAAEAVYVDYGPVRDVVEGFGGVGVYLVGDGQGWRVEGHFPQGGGYG